MSSHIVRVYTAEGKFLDTHENVTVVQSNDMVYVFEPNTHWDFASEGGTWIARYYGPIIVAEEVVDDNRSD